MLKKRDNNIILQNNIHIIINMKDHSNKRIIEFLKKNRVITSSELAKFLEMSWNTADKYLLELTLDGKVERIKKEGVNLWMLK
jgi:Mn-dependent DtxR family transcriptional regulator